MTMRNAEGGHLLLDPRFLIQVVLLILAGAGIFWKLQIQSDINTRDVGNLRLEVNHALEKIDSKLPNKEADNYRMATIEARLAKVESNIERVEAKSETNVATLDLLLRNTRERLAENGWKP